jgi:alkylation response protein AidB-like acyl-CoA dehydrogenase
MRSLWHHPAMDLTFSATDEAFRTEVQDWMAEHLVGEFRALGTGHRLGEQAELEVRKAWERELASGGWVGMGWPAAYGGRELPLTQQVIFHEEYVRAGGPNRVGFFGEELLGPTLMMFGTEELKRRFLPSILKAEEFWCQGFSEPDAGSDLANVKTTAVLDGDEWVINGQKVWTSLGHIADWIFVVCRTDSTAAKKHQGISFLLCPVDQPGVEMRPITQITGTAEFNEVFFSDARTAADLCVGEPGQGWKVVMGTLGFERGTAFLAEQLRWGQELDAVVAYARAKGLNQDPVVRQRLANAAIGLELVRLNGLRTLSQLIQGGSPGPEASIGKLHWSSWHQQLGELEMALLGAEGTVIDGDELNDFQYSFLWSRAETIFAGSSEIQRNIISERVLGLPREPA